MKNLNILLTLSFVCLLCTEAYGQNATPDYWKCKNPIGGSWTFGIAPKACDTSTFGDDRMIVSTYEPLIFSDAKNYSSERTRYMNEMNALIKEVAKVYLLKRNPDANTAEIEAFVRASLTMAHQESFWTHYRLSNQSNLKMMRGDFGHGHGLMQVDDRWHFVEVTKGSGWKLIDNILYSLEEYYMDWQAAKNANCIRDQNNFRAIARSAYSAYNGGLRKVCRWTNPNDKWARNDVGFIGKFDSQEWNRYISKSDLTTLVDIECLLNGEENCPLLKSRPPTDNTNLNPRLHIVYKHSDGRLCTWRTSTSDFECVTDARDISCLIVNDNILRSITSSDPNNPASAPLAMRKEWESSLKFENQDRHSFCMKESEAIVFPVGSILVTNTELPLRSSPFSGTLKTLPTGSIVQTLDFQLQPGSPSFERYYRVQSGSSIGWLHGGDISKTQSSLSLVPSQRLPSKQLILLADQFGRVIAKSGINVRSEPGGTAVAVIPNGSTFKTIDSIVSGDNNNIYYKIVYSNNKYGYIYAGRSLPEPTFESWVVIKP